MKLISRIAAPLLAGLVVVFGSLSSLTFAQEPAAFEMSVIPWSEQAVAGEPFTYTVVITNVSQLPFKDILVLTQIPTGTTFLSADQNEGWLLGSPAPGETGPVIWNTLAESLPEVATFELVVDVSPGLVNRQLVSWEYAIIGLTSREVITTSPGIIAQVVAAPPTPTPVASPSPTATAVVTPTPSATVSLSPTATFTRQAEVAIENGATPTPVATSSTSQTSSSSAWTMSGLLIIGILGLGIGIIGLIRFLKRR